MYIEVNKPILYVDSDQTQNGLAVMLLRYGREFGFTGPNQISRTVAEEFGKAVIEFGKKEIYEDPDRQERIFTKDGDNVYLMGDERFAVPLAKFELVRSSVRSDPRLHENLLLIPASQHGIDQIIEYGYEYGGTLTARPSSVGNTYPRNMEQSTSEWRRKKDLREPDKVTVVDKVIDKIIILAEEIRLCQKRGLRILIDDGISELSIAMLKVSEIPELQQSLCDIIIVGYEVSDEKAKIEHERIHELTGAYVLSLPNWKESSIKRLLQQINDIQKLKQIGF